MPEELKTQVGSRVSSSTTFRYSDEDDWLWKDWKSFLDSWYEPVVGIMSSYHFRLHQTESNGVVLRHSYSDGEDEKEHVMETWVKERNLYQNPPARKSRKKIPSAPSLEQLAYAPSPPVVLAHGGLSEKRATDLISNIKEHLHVENREAFEAYVRQNCSAIQLKLKQKRVRKN